MRTMTIALAFLAACRGATDPRIDEMLTEIDTLRADVDALQAESATLRTDLDATRADVTAANTSVAALETEVDGITGGVDITDLADTVDQLDADLDDHETRLASLEGLTFATEDWVESQGYGSAADITRLDTAVAGNTTTLASHTSTIATQSGTLATMNTSISGHDTRIATLESRANSADTQLTTLDTRADAVDVTLADAVSDVAQLQTDATTLDGRLDTHDASITTVNSDIVTLTSDITTAEAAIVSNDGKAACLARMGTWSGSTCTEFATVGCSGCNWTTAIASCPSGRHLCTSVELQGGALQSLIARKMAGLTTPSGLYVWTKGYDNAGSPTGSGNQIYYPWGTTYASGYMQCAATAAPMFGYSNQPPYDGNATGAQGCYDKTYTSALSLCCRNGVY